MATPGYSVRLLRWVQAALWLPLGVVLIAGPACGSSDEEVGAQVFDQCGEGPPDASCFAQRRDPDSNQILLARSIGDALLERTDPVDVSWDWGESVQMLGMVHLYDVTGDVRYRDYVGTWLEHHISEGFQITTSDTCAPAAIAALLRREGSNSEYMEVLDDALYYFDQKALTTPEGGLSHFGELSALGVSLWADSLFMFGNVMTRWGEITGEAEMLDRYAEQFTIFTDLLQSESGFYKHAVYTFFEQDEDVYWARANAWIVAAAYDHMRVRWARGETLDDMASATARLSEAIMASQDAETGLWWTVVNRPGESYLETSASALFAFALARGWRYGLVGDEAIPVIAAAIDGVIAQVVLSDDGRPVVTGVSGPTNVGTLDYYASVPLVDDISYGVGAVLLALTEVSGLPLDVSENGAP